MKTQPAGRTPVPVTAAGKGPAARTAGPAGRFLAELGGMCAVMCIGGTILSLAAFQAASWLGSPHLARQAPELSVLIIAVCLAVPMAAYMAVRRHPRRHNLEMTGSTIGVGLLIAGLLWSGVIPAPGPQHWHSLFGLVCGPACLLMIAEMLISSGTYSGRARHPGSAARAPGRQAAAAARPYRRRDLGKQVRKMTKRATINWWVWGLIAFVPGGILIPSSALALATHDPGINDAYGRTMAGLIAAGGLCVIAGVIAWLVAWVAAVLNTRQLADKRCHTALLWGGIAGLLTTPLFGLGALVLTSLMMAYLVAGPDGLAAEPRPSTPAKATITRWAGRGWVVDSYNLVFAALLLTFGSLSDRFGRKGMLLAGLAVVGTASLAGGFTTDPAQLIAARSVMGLGAAMTFPATLSLISNVFTGRRERARAIGWWSAISGVAIAMGPIVGGWLLEHFSWASSQAGLAAPVTGPATSRIAVPLTGPAGHGTKGRAVRC